jgi:hypothetical protein
VAATNANPKRLEVFKKGLAELGYVEGKNIRIEYREAVLDAEYNGIMTELVDRKIGATATKSGMLYGNWPIGIASRPRT